MRIKKENITWGDKCRYSSCNESNKHKDGGHLGYCSKHYRQLNKFGKIIGRTKHDKNEIIIKEDYVEIVLYSGDSIQKEKARALIDKNLVRKIKGYKWSMTTGGYVYSSKLKITLHRFVTGAKLPLDVHHINRNKLDNRKENLFACTRKEHTIIHRKSNQPSTD